MNILRKYFCVISHIVVGIIMITVVFPILGFGPTWDKKERRIAKGSQNK